MDSRAWQASTSFATICRSRAERCAESYGIRTGLNFASCAARSSAITRFIAPVFFADFARGGSDDCAPAGKRFGEQANKIRKPAHAADRRRARLGSRIQMQVFC